MDDSYAKAKTILARWLDRIESEASERLTILHGLDVVRMTLAERDGWFDVRAIELSSTEGVFASLRSRRMHVENLGGRLVVATACPGWGRGWSSLLPDEHAYDVLTWLLHYAAQYVHRSLVLKVILPIAEEAGVVSHPFGLRSINYAAYGPETVQPAWRLLAKAMELAAAWYPKETASDSEARCRVDLAGPWLNYNTVDPYVHQAAFHWLRGVQLDCGGFAAEAVGAFDRVFEVTHSFLVSTGVLQKQASRSQCAQALRLPPDVQEIAERTHFLRNHFAAHAGGWRWWDFDEMFADDLPDAKRAALDALHSLGRIEPAHRSIEPSPSSWSTWFWEHFEVLWKAVWYEALATQGARDESP